MKTRIHILWFCLLAVTMLCEAAAVPKMGSRANTPQIESGKFEYAGINGNLIAPKAWKNPAHVSEGRPVTVYLKSSHDPTKLRIFGLWAYNENGLTSDYSISDASSMTLEPGIYDFCCSYQDWTGVYRYNVIREQVEVEDGLELDFSPEEAVNTVSFVPVKPNGEKLEMSEYSYIFDDQGNWELQTQKEGNCMSVATTNAILVKGYGHLTGSNLSAVEGCLYSFQDASCIRINSVSDRYTFTFHSLYLDNNDEWFVLDGQVSGCGSDETLQNNPEEYNSFTQEYFLDVPAGIASGYVSMCDTHTYVNGIYQNGWLGGSVKMPNSTDRTVEYNIARPVIKGDGYFDQVSLFSTGLGYMHMLNDDGGMRIGGVMSNPSGFADGKMHTYFTGNGIYQQYMNNATSNTDLPVLPPYPGIDAFGYTPSDTEILPGSSAPSLCFKVQNSVSITDFPYFPWELEYRGVLGELRSIDLEVLKPTVKYGGVLQDVNDYESLLRYPAILSYSGETDKKVLEVQLEVASHNVIGKETGNKARMVMDLTKDDYVPPTLRMLMLRDEKNLITTSFPKDATVRVQALAGDFNFDLSNGNIKSDAVFADFYIAPAGSGSFTPFEMSAIDEMSSANFGYFYDGALRDLETGAYDIKVCLKDLSGNTQEQIIENAFEITKYAAVESVSAMEYEEVEVYDLMGHRISRKDHMHVNIPAGVYLIRDIKTGKTIKRLIR